MSNGAQKYFDLTGRVVLVAGGAGYLGVPICRALAECGARVVIADLRPSVAEDVAKKLTGEQLNVEAVGLDAGDEASIIQTINGVAEKHGRLDVLINATTFSTGKPMEQMSMADWEKGTHVSLAGAFALAREAGRVMVSQGRGSIIQFSSMYGIVSPDPNMYDAGMNVNPIDYGAAKAGILQMVRYQAVMWGPKGVRVNAIVPGAFPQAGGNLENIPFVKRLEAKSPMRRIGRADEIVGAALFLASDASSYVTGTKIVVDGGWTAW